MSKQVNPYYSLAKIFEIEVDYELAKDFVSQYVKIASKNGGNRDDAIMRLKNKSSELHDAIMSACVNMQTAINDDAKEGYTSEYISVNEAAEMFNYTPTCIRNWTKKKVNPLPSINLGDRQTRIKIKDLHDYSIKYGIKKKPLPNLKQNGK